MTGIKENRWKKVEGGYEMPEHQAEFLQWLVTPPEHREPRTYREWAAQHHLDTSTMRRWRADPMFRKEWEKALAEMNIHPDRVQEVIDALHKSATNGDVKAMETYLRMVDKISPPKIVFEEQSVRDMTEEQLAEALEQRAQQKRKQMKAV